MKKLFDTNIENIDAITGVLEELKLHLKGVADAKTKEDAEEKRYAENRLMMGCPTTGCVGCGICQGMDDIEEAEAGKVAPYSPCDNCMEYDEEIDDLHDIINEQSRVIEHMHMQIELMKLKLEHKEIDIRIMSKIQEYEAI